MAICKLGDLIKIKHGYAFKGNYISTEDNGIVLVTPGNFKIGGGFKEEKCKFFTSDYPSDYVLKPGDLIVTMTDLSKMVDTLGYSAIVPNSKRTYLHNQRIGLINIINSTIVDKKYLYWLMRSPKYQKTIAATSTGSTVHHTSPNRIYEYEFDLPQISVQRKIAKILSDIEEKINENSAINNNLEQQAQAIFKSWFIDFEPFNKTMPSDWTIGTIDDLAKKVVCGKTPSTKKAEYYGSNIPFITIPDMHGKTYAVTTERYLSKLGANSQVKKSLPKNSICVSCIGTAGLVTLVAEESQTNQQINSIIPKDGFSPYYIYLLMQTLSDTINKLGQSGSTIVNLNKSQFGKIQVIIPALSVMIKFDKIVSPMFEKMLQNQMENLKLTSLRDVLLPRLMSGELDVSDIEI